VSRLHPGIGARVGGAALTLGTLPLSGVCALFVLLGVMGGAFVLTWPMGADVKDLTEPDTDDMLEWAKKAIRLMRGER
jgi:hypothetical protein